MKLSVIIFAENQSPQLTISKKSVMGADQILVLSPRQLLKKNMVDDFAAARNKALKDAKNDWVFFIDSDEKLEVNWQLLQKQMEEILQQNKDITAFSLKRSDIFLGKRLKFGEAGSQVIIRIVDRRHQKFMGKVHEKAIGSGKTAHLNQTLLHFSHQDISSFLDKITNYSYLASQKKESFFIILLKLFFFPPGKFLKNFFLKLGFLDGMRGLTYALMMSLHSLLVRLFQLEKLLTKN